ncbi:MAG: hypothetical protein FRX48_09250 [Lasallia pustulata]|uniref:Uncharacterized protein n=1 Tax=Lasallia pustulata TaxID=136370 RepID=A0A5M8PDZ5_9LECA|nr:MAG: hypothetical protein FRX48_09250 [Lasallia pustulata]
MLISGSGRPMQDLRWIMLQHVRLKFPRFSAPTSNEKLDDADFRIGKIGARSSLDHASGEIFVRSYSKVPYALHRICNSLSDHPRLWV